MAAKILWIALEQSDNEENIFGLEGFPEESSSRKDVCLLQKRL